jgi:hypothetical protein
MSNKSGTPGQIVFLPKGGALQRFQMPGAWHTSQAPGQFGPSFRVWIVAAQTLCRGPALGSTPRADPGCTRCQARQAQR